MNGTHWEQVDCYVLLMYCGLHEAMRWYPELTLEVARECPTDPVLLRDIEQVKQRFQNAPMKTRIRTTACRPLLQQVFWPGVSWAPQPGTHISSKKKRSHDVPDTWRPLNAIYRPEQSITHTLLGNGIVVDATPTTITIQFHQPAQIVTLRDKATLEKLTPLPAEET